MIVATVGSLPPVARAVLLGGIDLPVILNTLRAAPRDDLVVERARLAIARGRGDVNHPIRVTSAHRDRAHADAHGIGDNTRSVSMSTENTIIEEIRAAYECDDRIPHPAEIAIAEHGGTVTLRGTVGSLHQVRAAAEIANSVRACKGSTTSCPLIHAIAGRMVRSEAPRCRR